MKNILILADGSTAKYFIDWVSKRRISENNYHIAFYRDGVLPENLNREITAHFCDPTSDDSTINRSSFDPKLLQVARVSFASPGVSGTNTLEAFALYTLSTR